MFLCGFGGLFFLLVKPREASLQGSGAAALRFFCSSPLLPVLPDLPVGDVREEDEQGEDEERPPQVVGVYLEALRMGFHELDDAVGVLRGECLASRGPDKADEIAAHAQRRGFSPGIW